MNLRNTPYRRKQLSRQAHESISISNIRHVHESSCAFVIGTDEVIMSLDYMGDLDIFSQTRNF